MEKIKVFTHTYVEKIFQLGKQNPKIYLGDLVHPEDSYANGETGLTIDKKLINIINTSVSSIGSSKEDILNSIKVYEALDINLTTASDPRLWVCLTHTIFKEYMAKRWPLENLDDSKMASRIKDRYHLRNLSLNNLSRNGISRLWWIAYLTKDENRKDKYELTRILASRQDLIAGLLERYLGSNKNIRMSILQFLLENEEFLINEDKRRDLIKKVNLVGGVKNMPLLMEREIKTEIEQIA